MTHPETTTDQVNKKNEMLRDQEMVWGGFGQ